VEPAQQEDDQENQEYSAEPYACTPTVTPAAMAVVPPTATEKQHQNDNQYQHLETFLSSIF
jgi:hypothetical protein